MTQSTIRSVALAGFFAVSGCASVGTDFHRPDAKLPDRWPAAIVQPSGDSDPGRLEAAWWRAFNDAELSSLVERSASANLDVKAATTRWMQARFARRIAPADAEPSVDVAISGQHARSSQNGLLDISGLNGKKDYNVWQPGVDASWELDLWGRVRREIEAADASVEVSADLRRGVLLSVLAETARDYLQLRGVQAQQAISLQDLDIARQSLRLVQVRFSDGVATQLETAEAAAQVSTIEAQLPLLDHEQVRLINALSYLLAEPPRALESELQAATPMPSAPPYVPAGLPSELAERRPDIREAEARLHAATAEIGVAEGDFYPRVTLSANVGIQAMHVDDLNKWSSRTFGIGPAISIPIFAGGRLKGQLALKEAGQKEAMIGFQRAVLGAWHDVDNAMSEYSVRRQRLEKLAATVEQDKAALESIRQQCAAGAADLLQVIAVQKELLAAQQALAASSTDVSVSLVGLYKALGGGWETSFPVGVTASGVAGITETTGSGGPGM